MEHTNQHLFRPFIGILLSITALLALSGCKKPIPNPESLDPLYTELSSNVDRVEKAIQEEEAALQTAIETLKTLEPRDITRRHTIQQRYRHERTISSLRQEKKFFLVRRNLRKEFVADEYLKAFNADKPWPDPGEIARYRKHQALRNASRNWDERVPKLVRHNKGYQGHAPASAEKAAPPKAH